MSIRKTALALGSALMLFTNTLNAQDQPWNFGVKTGTSMSWLQGSGELLPETIGSDKYKYKASGRIGIIGGLTAGYTFHENLGVGLEALYAGLGGKVKQMKDLAADSKEENKPITYRVYSDNIVLPLMLKWFPMGCDPEEGILTVDLGVQGVVPLNVRFEKKAENADFEKMKDVQDQDKKEEVDPKKIAKLFTLDAIAGISYEFPGIGLIVEGRYHLGLTGSLKNDTVANKYKKDNAGIKEDSKLRSHYATLSLGYNFARLLMN